MSEMDGLEAAAPFARSVLSVQHHRDDRRGDARDRDGCLAAGMDDYI
jgi:hypothetical protein